MFIRSATPDELLRIWSGATGPPDWETVLGDGCALRYELGSAADHRFSYGRDEFLITPDAGTVLCSVERQDDVRWQRQLLDTILFSASFVNGFELLHASAVEVDGGVVAFVAPSGGGKSSIAAELRRRGHRIFCDDVLAIAPGDGGLVCHPGPAVMSVPRSADVPAVLDANVIASFTDEDELWVALEHAATTPRPLRAVYLLDRHADSCFASKVATPTVLDLVPHAISLPHGPARARSRFELFATLAEQTTIFRLTADPTASVGTLADLVEASLDDARCGVETS